MRWLTALVLGLLPIVLPLPGGGSGRLQERPDGRQGFRSTVTFIDSEPANEGVVSSPAFPQFLKRKALAFTPLAPHSPRLSRSGAHEILLTFDDGPDLQTTPLVLEELDRRGIKAVFFVNGKGLMGNRPTDRARRYLLRKLAAHGHFVGNHSLSHQKLCLDQATIPKEIDGNAEIIAAITGVYPTLFRSPYGGTCQALEAALAQRGMINVGWNIDPQEWRGDDADTTVPAVLAQLERLNGRGILLLHDTQRSTPRALPRILDWIENHNRRWEDHKLEPVALRPQKPFQIVDYTVFLPVQPLPVTGIELLLTSAVEGIDVLPVPYGRLLPHR